MNSKYRILASNTIVFAIGNILVKLISFFLMPLYTSVLTTEQYGVAELLNNTIEIVLPIATLCIVEALYRFSIDKNTDHSMLFVNSLAVVIVGDFFVAIASCIWYFVFHYEYALYFLLLFVTTTFYKLTCQFARGLGHVKRFAFYGVCNALLLVLSNVILLVVFHGGVVAYLASFSIGYGVSGFLAFIISKEYKYFHIGHFRMSMLKNMLAYSMPNIPNLLSWWINSLSDRYIVLFYWGAGTAGLYTAASKLPALINLVTSIFQQAWQYSTAKEIESKNNKAFFSNIFRIYSYICVSACGGILLVNKLVCKILLQADFYIAWKFVPLLLLAATFGCIATYFGTFYNAVKNNKMLMISTLIGAIVNFVLNFSLIPKLGGMGAAIATAISYFLIMIIRMLDVRRFIELDINVKRFILQFGILILATGLGCIDNLFMIVLEACCFIGIILSDCQILIQLTGLINKIIHKSTHK